MKQAKPKYSSWYRKRELLCLKPVTIQRTLGPCEDRSGVVKLTSTGVFFTGDNEKSSPDVECVSEFLLFLSFEKVLFLFW